MKFEEIVWNPDAEEMQDPRWGEKLGFIKLLLQHGRVVERVNYSYAENLPRVFKIDGLLLTFLPDWNFFKVGENEFRRFPKNGSTLFQFVGHLKAILKYQ